MKNQKKNKVPASTETETAVAAMTQETVSQEAMATEAPAAIETEKKVKGEKGKEKVKKAKKDKKR